MTRLRIATWNLHGARGLDGRVHPERIAAVVAELDADVIALQEFRACRDVDLAAALMRDDCYRIATQPTFERRGVVFGNALLSRWPIAECVRHDLAVEGCEPRGALAAVIDLGGPRLQVVATHLGLRRAERRRQIETIRSLARAANADALVLAGDFNAIMRHETGMLDTELGADAVPATFPSLLPLLALDRIWAAPGGIVREVRAHRSLRARIASDHLPLVATLDLSAAEMRAPARVSTRSR